jgi:hypothetical protein
LILYLLYHVTITAFLLECFLEIFAKYHATSSIARIRLMLEGLWCFEALLLPTWFMSSSDDAGGFFLGGENSFTVAAGTPALITGFIYV